MAENDKTYSILQVEFANKSEGWLRKLTRGDETYHARLVLRDDDTREELAELCFSAKNGHGKTIPHAIFRPINALRAIADCFGLGRRYETVMNNSALAASVPHLKGVLLTRDHHSCIAVQPEYPQEVRFTGNEDEALLTMESLCNATEELNRSGVIFTSIGFREAANNCRAGTKAVSDAGGLEFAPLHKKANLGAGSKLSSALALSASGDARRTTAPGDIHTRLQIMSARLRGSVRALPGANVSEIDAEYV